MMSVYSWAVSRILVVAELILESLTFAWFVDQSNFTAGACLLTSARHGLTSCRRIRNTPMEGSFLPAEPCRLVDKQSVRPRSDEGADEACLDSSSAACC